MTVVLLVLAIACLGIGAITKSAFAFLAAALLSAIVVLMLRVRLRGRSEKPFVTDAPAQVEIDLDRPVKPVPPPQSDSLERDYSAIGIDDWDSLLASEILPLLETMSLDQLREVIAYEHAGRGREVVITRAKALIELTEHSLGLDLRSDSDEPTFTPPGPRSRRRSQERNTLQKKTPDIGL